jgi:hypothetical protein
MQRVLSSPYTERDVEDVESYVRDAVANVSPYLPSDEREQLVVRGIVLVRRMAQALPPEASLDELLRDRLGNSLAVYRWRGARQHVAAEPASSRAA